MCASLVPDRAAREKLDSLTVSLGCPNEKRARFVESVETLDQKVGLETVNCVES